MHFTHMSVARKLKFYQLVAFDQVLQSGSLLRAAQALNLTQPAVTKIIHELESYFGAPLLVRSNRGVSATPLGERVARRGKSLLAELRALTDEVNAYQEGTSGHVVVGTLISASSSLLPQALQLLKQRAPKVLVSLRVGQMDQLFPALTVGEVDLVVGRVPDDWRAHRKASQLEVTVLYGEELAIVAGARHPLLRQPRVQLGQLLGCPWVLPTQDSLLRRTVDGLFHEAELPLPGNLVESLSILTNISLMQDQQTVAVMPLEAARQFTEAGLLGILDLGRRLQFGDIGYFRAGNRDLGPAVQLFQRCLEEAGALQHAAPAEPANIP
ncbi:Transcriptional regulator, LysR family [Pseudomonas sp. FeS53a]|jgi:DNA-binding transcriptional LysR family regulator|uniref:LysR substrate-binding domain-containing protein n=1 Tax=Pseudomonas sp. FeS53a TaxID=1604022 RepID=UPI0005CB4E85|nr:LysR substrate-binding domain-containing protein [Pseudomonas sp. FeS53a]KIV62435.1 Transcriptional regulator, LysR family [Pseudomonas sp. FeS53a]